PQVELLPAEWGLPMKKYDLREVPDVDAQLAALSAQEVEAPFDLACGPLIRAALVQLADDEHVFLLTQHHIVSDGWSFGILKSELETLYSACLNQQSDPLPPLAIQYPDYAAWQRQWLSAERIQSQSDYWRTRLADAPVLLDLPTDRPRPPQQSFTGTLLPVSLDAELTQSLKRLSEQQGVTLFMTLLAAWATVLSRLSGQEDLVIGTPSAGRGRQEVESLIGFFVNTLALRMDLSGAPTVTELLARVRQTALAAQEHQDLPFEQVVEIVQPPRQLAHTPLFQVMFAWQNNESTEWRLPGLAVSPVEQAFEVVKFDLELNLSEVAGRIVGYLNYATALFDQSTIERQVEYLHTVLREMAANPQQPVRKIDILTVAERRLLLETWNAIETPDSEPGCIHQLFEQQVEKTPDAIALVYEKHILSYAELNARANRLAHQLMALGVAPDQRVAICVSRSPAMVVGLLAVLKAGGAYVPLDPVYTGERLAHILTDAAPAILLADRAGRDVLGEDALAGLTVLDPNNRPDQPDSNPLVPALTARHLAYVIYTSGSTGMPKGVMVEHRHILRLFEATESRYHFNRQDIWCLFHSIAFDFSVWELWGALRYGAKLVLVPHAVARSPQELHQFVCRHGITVLNQTPSAFKAFIASDIANPLPDCLRYIIFGGEALDPGILKPWYARRAETSPQLVNMYGITETTVHVTYRALSHHDVEQITSPIGTRIPDLTLYLLDKYGQPVPLGTVGELYVGGAGVARGYLNRPELTAERFLPDPFSGKPDARMYRTGDLARYLPDGNLAFLGRNDQQVKIRGFRIEPGEIEARLMEHPAVREALVLAQGDDQDKRLVAYVVAAADEALVNRLRTHLSAILPDYMVPAAFVRLDSFPLTPNGKLDRRALPAPGAAALARQVYEAPQGETETLLAAVWGELLGIEQVSRHDSFFGLGGHSLLAVRMIDRLRHAGLTLAVRDLFQSPVLSDFAQTAGQSQAVVVPANVITPATTVLTPEMLPLIDLTQPEIDRIVEQVPGGIANIQDIYALSPLQDGILFHHLLANAGDPYLLASQMAFADRALLDSYLAAVQRVINRHDILRTAFIWQGLSAPVQVVWRQAPLLVTELTFDPVDGPVGEQLAHRFNPRHYRLDLHQVPLLYFVVAQESDGRWIAQQLQHHLIGDHTTMEVMNREVLAYLAGQENSLPAPVPFRNLVAQARLGVSQDEHTRFFTELLAEVDEPTQPFGLIEVHRDGSQVTESHRMLSAVLNSRLRSQARRLGVSLAALSHLAWALVLSRISGQAKVVFGTVLFGRMQAGEGADSGMGLFINTLPLRLDMDDTAVQDSVRQAHARLAKLLEHEHASLALAQRCSGVSGETPLFSALLNYRHNTPSVTTDEIISGIEFLSGQERTNYPFVLSVEDFGDALGLTAQIAQPIDPERICGYMQQALESLAEVLEQRPETPVRTLNILPEAEKRRLLETWNATQTPYPDQYCIHQRFEQQVEKKPDAIALVYKEQAFSYVELNVRANRLAHQLIALGVVPDQRVAICVANSPARIVGLLAVLKAGGTYVPLDPAYPGERLVHILIDADAAILLADNAGCAALGETALAGLTVMDPNVLPDQPDSNPQVTALTPRHLAYVIYTSGSTGIPKGVMVEHRGLVNLIQEKIAQFDIHSGSRILQFASFGFDASVWEIMMALCGGAALVIPINSVRQDSRHLWHYLEEQAITHACLTPALLRDGVGLPEMTIKPVLILGGEAPSAALLRALSHRATVFNAYGPTEITVCAAVWRCPPNYMDGVIAIGRPTANTQVYLLNTDGQPVPLGAVGELYIGGVGVARGYLNRPELTAERFLPDPFSEIADARLYRSGDLARYLPDGNLEFLGRNDQQVKIRGFRIEPGEIEARLVEYPTVQEAVVLAQGDGHDKRLIAYVVAHANEGLVNSLRTHLSAILPDYMVPAAFVRLDALPLTPNGKLDRQALPVPGEEAFARQIYAAPQGEMETTLAAIWRELLGVEKISRYDNFFALGGHSLLAVRMMNRIAALGIELPLSTLFKCPSLLACAEEMCAQSGESDRILPAIVPLSREGQLPLSFAQQRLWFLAQLDGVSDTYHIPLALRLRGQLDITAWQHALNLLFARHEALRSVFVTVDGQPQVELLPSEWGLPMKKYDLREEPEGNKQLKHLCAQEAEVPFDLIHGPLIRAALVQLANDDYVFLLTQHHIISDGWSFGILKSELERLYAACLNQQPDPLLPLTIQYPDYAAWQRQWLLAERIQSQSDYWRTRLADAPVLLDLPTDRPRPPEQSFAGNILPISLDKELTQSFKRLSEQQGVTLFMTLLAAWATVLSRLSGQEDLVIGTPSAGRGRQEVESLIGFFVNTLALRMDLSGEPNMTELLARVRQTALAAQEHQDLPFEQVVEIVQPPRRLAHTPLFQVMFAWQNNEDPEWELPGLAVSPIEQAFDVVKFDLELNLSEVDGRIVGYLNYATALFDQLTIERYVGYLSAVLQAIVINPQQPVGKIDILTAAERKLLLETWNATETEYADQCCIHRLFEQQAEKTPDATALMYEEHILSYAELNARANRLAHQLIELGVKPDQRVVICVTRSPSRVVGLLAVLKAGGAYVPLDPAYPGERLTYMLRDSASSVILADQAGCLALGEEALAQLTVIDPNTCPDQPDNNLQIPALTSRHLAYVIYTSGSTGMPKGVMVEHRGLVNLIQEKIAQFDIHSDSRVLQFASFGFDAGVWETMMALCSGATLAIPADTIRQDPLHLWHYLEEQSVTHACLTPALLRDGANLPEITIRPTLILGGDVPSAELFQALCGRATLFNAYGPTEITVCATTWRCPSDYISGVISIGRPTANTRIYLLDTHGQPVPLGAVGELYVGGVGVARGYLNRPELTTERFLIDSFSETVDARLYRTGDLARYLPDGNLVFAGRNDQQVKIRGFRIEPGEIEARLTEHPAVSEGLVLARDAGQDKRLIAYVVAEPNDGLVADLREYLSAILPDYMVPAAFVRLDTFPLTPNGKLDRRALPAPGEEAFARQIYAAPQGEMETTLAAIWRELLGVERISRYDNFFALGGHSLLVVRMMNRIAALGIELPLTTLFKSPSLIVFAEVMRARFGEQSSRLPAIMPISREGKLPLSFAQQRLWFLAQFDEVSDTYHIPVALRLRGQLDIGVWQQALDVLFARHEALRSVFIAVDGQPQVELLPAESGLPIKKYDLRGAPDADAQLASLSAQEAETPFDLACGPLIRSSLVQLANDDHIFLLTQHHIVFDGWSVSVLMHELSTLYTAFLVGQPDPLPPLTIQYPDYAAWQRQWLSAERIQSQSDYWRTKLADAPVLLDLPTDRPRPSQQSFTGNILPVSLDPELTQSLKRLSEQQGVTLFMTLLAAWATVLSRLSGQEDLVIGTPSAGRSRQEVESLIGFFVNTLALRMDLSGTPNVVELLARTQQTALAAQEHQDLPFEQVVEIVQPPRRLAHTPLFQVMFAWQNNDSMEWGLPGLAVSPADQRIDIVKFDLELSLSEVDGRIAGYLNYVTALFDQSTIERHVEYLHTVLREMAASPKQAVGKIDILTVAERQLLLETWNATQAPYPNQSSIHRLFEQQAEKTPDAIALVYEERILSYAELNARANRLARRLIGQGIRSDDRVAVMLERSIELVVAQLAILKAGAVYVPIDPRVPDERKNWLINDCSAKLLLTDIPVDLAIPLFYLADEVDAIGEEDHHNIDLPRSSTALAYIMYTSGSTGTPKGVMVPHRAVVRLVINNGYAEIGPDDRVAFTANPAFDAGTFEIWAPLLNGGALVVIDHDTLLTPHKLVQVLQVHCVTVLWLSVGLFNRMAAELSPVLPQLKILMVGGDVLDPHVIAQVLRDSPPQQLLNGYGPSEGTTFTTTYRIAELSPGMNRIPIGRPIANTRVYLLDTSGQPVPIGVIGEIYVGGDGVACGYLNRPELTAERFLPDPFSNEPDARMYRTGDLARYLPDGNLEFLGRNDQQVKIRGFRIEPGEIEARLVEHPAVSEAIVLVLGDGQDKRLVAYVVAEMDEELVNRLRMHLSTILPDYMVPSAFVRLDSFPLTPNGKLDRRALPGPGEEAFARQVYEAPQGETETTLAAIWSELLGIEQISRHDSFFALGGHSLLAVRMIDRLRNAGLTLSVRDLFQFPVLSEFAQTAGQSQAVVVPVNTITPATTALTPEMLPLIDLTQPEIDHIVEHVPGGMTNIQDIYALSPLQDGILFHHLLANQGDPYLLAYPVVFADRSLLDRYLAAVQQVVDRHDILRTAFVWQGLSVPAQVVWRQAPLSVTELTLDPADGPVYEQLFQRFDPRQHRLDLGQAPLLRFVIAQETDGCWSVLQLQHHLIGDHTAMEVMNREVQAYLTGQENSLPAPVPFRNLVAQVRLGVSQAEHTRFFTEMLAEVDEPTLPFGLTEVHQDGSQVTQSHRMLPAMLNDRLRSQARRLDVSLAALCHLAWAQVLSRTSGQEKVVFGTVLLGRMQAGEGADSGMGLFINTLPLRLDMNETPVQESVRAAHTRLAGLLEHEHASLALAQRCSGVQNEIPLFSALLNYRHNAPVVITDEIISGIEFQGGQERTNYPFVLSVEDFGNALGLTAQIVQPIDSERVCGYMQQALESLAEALEQRPETPVRLLNILPEAEKRLLLETWNATQAPYPDQSSIHRLFEQQAEKTPDAIALVYEERILSYAELNARANRLARWLIGQGIRPDDRVAVLLARSVELVVAQLAILKAGAVYVPIDPRIPDERLHWLINDCSAKLLLTDSLIDLAIPLYCLANEMGTIGQEDHCNPDLPRSSTALAYIMYTSGSTGTPKGVMVPHRAVVRLVMNNGDAEIGQDDRVAFEANPAFDAGTFEVWAPLLNGGTLVVIDHATVLTPQAFVRALQAYRITVMWLSVGLFNRLAAELSPALSQLKILIVGGDVLDPHVIAQVLRDSPPQQFLNGYGPSEGTTFTTTYRITSLSPGMSQIPIGRPIANTRVYLLDVYGQPVPLGVVGELYIGGAGVACGYLNRPELTAERFLVDPFSDSPDARLYRSGDLARYLPDGNLEFIGRNDQQVKIRGFRIEPGEIEARLMEHPTVQEATVLVLGDGQDKRLIAYVVAPEDKELANSLRAHLSAILPDYMVPAAFVRLDVFPLTPNGKLDRRALPAPGNEAFARQVYEAPQGETETVLAAIWCELLGIGQVSRYDNFFALGGHSLFAMRMINLAANHGLVCTLNDLFQFPVLAELAAKMTSEPLSQPRNRAISVRSGGTGLPLFFVPSGLGDYSYVFGLSQQIQPGYPIYALSWPSISEEPMLTMEEQAARMISFMKAVQPEGPYRLCGYSSGGILAYAIAQQLLNSGEMVNFLGLIDTPAPYYYRQQITPPKLQFFIELARQTGKEHIDEIAALYRRIDQLNLVQFIEAAQKLTLYPANLCSDLIARRWEQIENYAQIVRDYEPQILAITLHQFYATEPSPPAPVVVDAEIMDAEPQSLNRDPSLGWAQVLPDSSLRLIPISGNHFSLFENNADKVVLVRALNMALAEDCDG
ncbi:amino acid adenylation domain-containing protein, partial [Photorhabdus sp. RM323S]|uniref:non-ribosomal peptide synthetase n=1 Tax=Photorhabdus sp. RM323S TaxID=3342828 RepID=UPI0036DBB630